MTCRGWDNYLAVGVSESPHGGFGFLHYRNVLSNYFDFRASGELGRDVERRILGAYGNENLVPKSERLMSIEYMNLHILKLECGIGSNRHRDSQEILLSGIMVTGDWCQFPEHERCFEIRTLMGDSFSLLKPGELARSVQRHLRRYFAARVWGLPLRLFWLRN
jgi:hypothetical protein